MSLLLDSLSLPVDHKALAPLSAPIQTSRVCHLFEFRHSLGPSRAALGTVQSMDSSVSPSSPAPPALTLSDLHSSACFAAFHFLFHHPPSCPLSVVFLPFPLPLTPNHWHHRQHILHAHFNDLKHYSVPPLTSDL